jgi:hypothetical protein
LAGTLNTGPVPVVAGGASSLADAKASDKASDKAGDKPADKTADEPGKVSAAATADVTISNGDAAKPQPVSSTVTGATTISDGPETSDRPQTASTNSPETLPAEAARMQPSGQDLAPGDTTQNQSSIEIVDECWVVDICVDRYLWALYERAPKEDTIRVSEQRSVTVNVTVKKKHKKVTIAKTVTRTFTRSVDENFTWKDQKASEKSGMPMADYVIGGMDRSFKLKLFHILHAADEAGLSPGITSAFRDDYRQSIASGLKAANDRSYHGGSFRGGYGHGLAADVVSVKGATRAERWTSTEILWKWIDAHAKEFGVGRPYLGRDPPHLAPIDGQEYAKHYHGDAVQHANADAKNSDVKKRKHVAAREDHSRAKRSKTARASKVGKIRSARDTPSRSKLHG